MKSIELGLPVERIATEAEKPAVTSPVIDVYVAPKYAPIGEFAFLLDEFEAPEAVQCTLARRVGMFAGSEKLPFGRIEDTIKGSMGNHGGVPHWEEITEKVASIVREENRRERRRV